MKNITLQFCSFRSFWGGLIPWFTQGAVGHVDVVLPPNHPRAGDLLGAQHEAGLGGAPAGVQIRPADYGRSCRMYNRYRVTLAVPDEDADRAYKFLYAQIGKPYDTLAIAAFIFGRNWREDDAWFCDELAMAFVEQTKRINRLVTPNNKITPQGAFLICSAVGKVEHLSDKWE